MQALIVLEEERSVSLAARRLNVTQPAMSATLRKLREFFDDPLLVRTAGGLIATERADQILVQARQVASMMRALEQGANGFSPDRDRLDLRIAASDFVHGVFLPTLMQKLLDEAPGVTVAMRPLTLDTIDRDFEKDALDFAVLPNFLAPANLQMRKLFDETFVYLMHRDHPSNTASLTLMDLSLCRHVKVVPGSADRSNRVDRIFRDAGFKRDVRVTVNNYASAVDMVGMTDLVTLFPTRMAGLLDERFVTHPAPFELKPISMCLIWHPRKQSTKAHKWARDFIAKTAKALDHQAVSASE